MLNGNGKQRVLVLDDEPRILTSIRDVLEDEFQVFTAESAERALSLLRREEVAVVLSDQRMPGLTGDQFLARAAQISQATRILITAYADMDALVRAVNDGQIYAYIAKPWDRRELKVTVLRAAHHYALVRQIEHERDLLRALMDSVPDLVYFKDSELRFTRVNLAHARFLGAASPQAVAGKTDADFLPESAAGCEAEERGVIASGLPVLDKLERVVGRWYSAVKVPILDERNRVQGLVAILRDVTRWKQAEEELRRAHDELELRVRERTAELLRSNRDLEAFTYSVSHDLRTPLRHIRLFSEMVLEDSGGDLPAGARSRIEYIHKSAVGMTAMVEELLKLSQIGLREIRRQTVFLRKLVDEVLAECAPELERRTIRFEIGELPAVECDSVLTRVVFANLISNAIKFTRPRAEAVVEIRECVCAGVPAVMVRDNGVGFDMKSADRLFAVFQRMHRQEDFEGVGAGLAIVQRIIHKHGGEIWAEAEPDRGAAFYFTLVPCAAALPGCEPGFGPVRGAAAGPQPAS